jgi:8-oxo-dGTP pyrophosphatase MutT (NUDIX family)
MSAMPYNKTSPVDRRIIVSPGFDPLVQPIVSCTVLPLLDRQALKLDFINHAFSRSIAWKVEPVFTDSFSIEGQEPQDVTAAAVFFPLIQRADGLHVLFTRRASHLSNHGGQISFPGGRIEPSDQDAVAAALRETQEEIGVGPEFIRLIGMQPSFLTSTRFAMKPVIGELRPGFVLKPDASEVAEVFEVPLSVLMDTGKHCLHLAQLPSGNSRYYFSITWGSYFIWGATAALIRNFYHYLAAAQNILRS